MRAGSEETGESASSTRSLARSTTIMSIGTILSRVTGVARLAVIAATLGVAETRLTDTYNLANMVPNIIYELVLGGVTGAIFVPLFVELIEKEDGERASEVISGVINRALLILAVISAVGIAVSPLIARFYALRLTGDDVVAQQQAIEFLLRLFIPQIVLYGLYSLCSAVLNARRRFGLPMYTPIVNNIVLIAVLVAFGWLYGTVGLDEVTTTQLAILGVGTTLSVAPMGALLIPSLRRSISYRPILKIDHPALGRLRRLAVYLFGFVAVNQLGYVVVQWLANRQQGAYTAYISAFTFFLLPVGLFVWSLTTALLPSLSAHAANERWDGYRDDLLRGLRATLFLTLPAAIGYALLARPIVALLLEHGVVTARSTELVSDVLVVLVLGLVQFSLFQLLVRAFYALHDARTPFLINCVVMALAIGTNVPLFVWFGVEGLAAGQAVAYTIGVALQLRALRGKLRGTDFATVLAAVARMAIAAAVMGGLVYATWAVFGPESGAEASVHGALTLVGAVAVGAGAYVGLAAALRIEEVAYLRSMLARRRSSNARAGP